MIYIVVVGHGHLGDGLIQAAEMITGPADGLYSVPLMPGESPEAYSEKLAAVLMEIEAEETLILIDLFGGTPYNVAAREIRRRNVECVTGANLPMLLELLMTRDDSSLQELAQSIAEAGQSSVKNLGPMLR